MLKTSIPQQYQFVNLLVRLRQEWQEAADHRNLLEVEGNMGMLLADLINGMGLGIEEQLQVLGTDLYQELQDFLHPSVSN